MAPDFKTEDQKRLDRVTRELALTRPIGMTLPVAKRRKLRKLLNALDAKRARRAA
jgi:hypothetical protein